MPTKVVLDVSDKRAPPVSPLNSRGAHMLDPSRFPDRNLDDSKPSSRNSSRRIVSFRSSIFREHESDEPETKRGISTSDIRASPRLIGYIYQLLASTVLLISVVKFYRTTSHDHKLLKIAPDLLSLSDQKIYQSVAGPVYYWKLVAAAIVASLGAGVCLIIALAHFDTVCCSKFWVTIFRDGSRWEQNLLRFMIVFWAFGLHVCTSSLSVGEIQGNVYFTTWIAFASSCVNYGVWRSSAGLPSLAEKVSLHHRETTYNWIWLLLCMAIFAGSSTDIFFNRSELAIRFGRLGRGLSEREWRLVLVTIWSFLGLGLLCVLLNHYATRSLDIRIGEQSRIVLGWRHGEGLVILLMIGVFFWLIYSQTGVDGVINGLTNAYFSIWGAFFNSVFLLGTWLRENKHIGYIVDSQEESRHEDRKGVTFHLNSPER